MTTELPGIARDLVLSLSRFEHQQVLARLDDPHDGGALAAPLRGLLRARALASGERLFAAFELLKEVRAMKDLSALERVEAQVRSARVLRAASPLVDHALELALAAARSGVRAGAD
nr:hypothetical protein [Myxococcota bacterium]